MSARLTVHLTGTSVAGIAAAMDLAPPPTAPQPSDRYAAYADAFALFGWSGPAGADLPLAAVTYTHDFGSPPPAWCARLDPVCLMPAGATLRLLDLTHAPLSPQEALDLFARASTADVIEQIQWRMGAPLRWYVLGDQAPQLETSPPDSLPAGHVAAGQPTGMDAPRWQHWLNELQMLLFDAAANLDREARDLPPANGLWLWGGGVTPTLAAPAIAFDAVWTDQPVIGGLARLAGLAPQSVPESAAALLDVLLVGHGLLGLGAESGTVHLVEQWLNPLRRALDTGRLSALTLHADGGQLHVRPRGLLARLRLLAWRRARRPA